MTEAKPSIFRGPAMRLFLTLICCIFVGEGLVMFLLDALPPLSRWATALLDSTLLMVPVFPMLYFLVFRPLTNHIAERQRAEEKLRESKEKYRLLIENQNDLVVHFDLDNNIQFVNPTYCATFGKREDELLGRSFFPLIQPEDRPRVEASLKKVLAPPHATEHEERALTAEGWRWFAWVARGVFSKDGQVTSILSVGRDITERKRAEAQTREQELLNQTLLDSLPCVALLMRPKTREIVAMNKAAKEAGCDFGHTCFESWAKISQPCPWCLASKLWAEGQAQSLEVETLGIVWDAHWDPVSDDLYLHYAFDITERKRSEEALRESEERLAEAQRIAHIGNWSWDLKTNKQFWSKENYGIFGLPPETPPSYENFLKTVHPDDVARVKQAVEDTLERNQPYDVTFRITTGEKETRFIQALAKLDHDEAGKPRRMYGTVQDITERKRMDEVQAFLAQTSSGTTGEPFFNALARYLARCLGMEFVCIDRLEGDGLTARTVAVWHDDKFEDNVTYDLHDTPCGDVVGQQVCCFPARVCELFPRDSVLRELRAESYAGVTLWSHAGQPIGLIAVIGRSPLANRPLAEATLKLAAVRAAGELERLDGELALRQQAEALRARNEELTRFNRASVGRELRMVKLKKEINELRRAAGQPPRYRVDFAEAGNGQPAANPIPADGGPLAGERPS